MTAAIARLILALDEYRRMRRWRKNARWAP
jgi:hypothetical protein